MHFVPVDVSSFKMAFSVTQYLEAFSAMENSVVVEAGHFSYKIIMNKKLVIVVFDKEKIIFLNTKVTFLAGPFCFI